jgi:transglutaminase-like putative cysteine protease
MYDIRQFKLALYLLLILGMSGFALAAEMPGIWLLGMGLVSLNGWLMATKRFRPISRLAANLITIAAVLYVGHELLTSLMTPIVVIGEFLVFLQLVKLWEQRANRDYAQLLVLSLLLMVAASMNTANLGFAILLVAYLFLSLYCCLLFHLKVETDAARAAAPVPPEKLGAETLRQDQRYLPSSMRRLTALVSIVAITAGVLVFLFFPRGAGGGLLGPLQAYRGASALVGFSDQVSFQDVARITQSHESIAFIKVWHNDQPVVGENTLLLRGLTLDHYDPPSRPGGAWEWARSVTAPAPVMADPSEPLREQAVGHDVWRQEISLWPTHTDVLFALAGPVQFTPRQPLKVRYTPQDGALQTAAPLNERIDYEVLSTNDLGPNGVSPANLLSGSQLRQMFPRIYAFARRPEVSGSDAQGPLADQRLLQGIDSPLDKKIASNIEAYLRSNFTYTLDLTEESRVRGRNPIEAFLYDWKKGHCEYFAGAMTLMCQTLGMQARVVIGFKCAGDDYNSLNETYTVHDSDAHAWVEIKTPQGWQSFDPTSSTQANASSGSGWLIRARHLMEYLEFTYANAVIAYDSKNRQSVIASVESGLTNAANAGTSLLERFNDLVKTYGFWNASSVVLICFMIIMLGAVAMMSGMFVWGRWRLRRRAERIGIEALPESEQMRLVRQLGFYDDLLRLLDRHRIDRPAHLTPMEFSRSLSFLPADAYDTVQRLTTLFYKVRYGGVELPAARQKKLNSVLAQLGSALGRPGETVRAAGTGSRM